MKLETLQVATEQFAEMLNVMTENGMVLVNHDVDADHPEWTDVAYAYVGTMPLDFRARIKVQHIANTIAPIRTWN